MDFVLSMLQDKEEIIIFVVLFMNLTGIFLKNKTKLNNDYIPIVLMALGLIGGWFLVDKSIYGVIAGAMCAFTSTGVHQGLKTTKHLIVGSVGDELEKRAEEQYADENTYADEEIYANEEVNDVPIDVPVTTEEKVSTTKYDRI